MEKGVAGDFDDTVLVHEGPPERTCLASRYLRARTQGNP
jgi:hypothetical protein